MLPFIKINKKNEYKMMQVHYWFCSSVLCTNIYMSFFKVQHKKTKHSHLPRDI